MPETTNSQAESGDPARASFTRIEFADPDRQDKIDGTPPPVEETGEEDYDLDEFGYYGQFSDSEWETNAGTDIDNPPERLGYDEFNPHDELIRLRQLSSSEQELPLAEQQALVRNRIETYKQALLHQQGGLRQTLQTLYDQIHQDPDAELTQILDNAAQNYRFSTYQYQKIEAGIDDYYANHQAVESLYAQHEADPARLYEACFGVPPKGQVDVIKHPMTLHFQCFESEDYVIAHAYDLHQGQPDNITSEKREKAMKSGGAAVHAIHATINNQPLPNNIVTIEKNTANRVEAHDTTIEQRQRYLDEGEEFLGEFFFNRELRTLTIKTASTTRQLTREPSGDVIHVQETQNNQTTTYDLIRHKRDNGEIAGWTRSDQPNSAPQPTYQAYEDYAAGRGYQSILEIGSLGLRYEDNHEGGAMLTYTEAVTRTRYVIGNPTWSEALQRHEEQHQFNALFMPLETKHLGSHLPNIEATLKYGTDPEHTKERILTDAARDIRRDLIDSRTRNEMLAFYRDGSSTDEIRQTLTHNPLYRYRDETNVKKRLDVWSETLKTNWADKLVAITYDGTDQFASIDSVKVTDAEIQTALDHAFGPDYEHQIARWTDVIAELEAAGHHRDEIVAMLYSEPASHWAAYASLYVPDLRKKLTQRAQARQNQS